MTHMHHIIPRHAGGDDSPENLIELSVAEHAEAHRVLWEQNHDLRDKLAWKMLSGKTDEAEEIRVELAKHGFQTFLEDTKRTSQWKKNISRSLRGQVQTLDTRKKRSESLKEAYRTGKKLRPSFPPSHYSTMGKRGQDAAAAARRTSSAWHESVRSKECRRKKLESSPTRQSIEIDGVVYPSLREAARSLGVSYSRFRRLYLHEQSISDYHD